jgi:hypothetical protein
MQHQALEINPKAWLELFFGPFHPFETPALYRFNNKLSPNRILAYYKYTVSAGSGAAYVASEGYPKETAVITDRPLACARWQPCAGLLFKEPIYIYWNFLYRLKRR